MFLMAMLHCAALHYTVLCTAQPCYKLAAVSSVVEALQSSLQCLPLTCSGVVSKAMVVKKYVLSDIHGIYMYNWGDKEKRQDMT